MGDYIFDFHNFQQWRDHLETEGFVVIANVLDNQEIAHGISLFEKHMKSQFSEISFSDERSMSAHWPDDDDCGFISDKDIASSDFMWYCRTNSHVLEIFRRIFQNNDLVTCFDRANAVRNTRKDTGEESWAHIDYPVFDEPPFECFQSFLNFVDCSEKNSPCLRVYPGSHKDASVCQWVRENYYPSAEAFFTIRDEKTRQRVNVLAPAGSLVVWNSKTIHDGRTSVKSKRRGFGPLLRLVAYLCYAPRSCIRNQTEADLLAKIFEDGSASTHWPAWHVTEANMGPCNKKRAREIEESFPEAKKIVVTRKKE